MIGHRAKLIMLLLLLKQWRKQWIWLEWISLVGLRRITALVDTEIAKHIIKACERIFVLLLLLRWVVERSKVVLLGSRVLGQIVEGILILTRLRAATPNQIEKIASWLLLGRWLANLGREWVINFLWKVRDIWEQIIDVRLPWSSRICLVTLVLRGASKIKLVTGLISLLMLIEVLIGLVTLALSIIIVLISPIAPIVLVLSPVVIVVLRWPIVIALVVIAVVLVVIWALARTTKVILLPVVTLVAVVIELIWLCLLYVSPLLQLVVVLRRLLAIVSILIVIWSTSMGNREVNTGFSSRFFLLLIWLWLDIVVSIVACCSARILTEVGELVEVEIRSSSCVDALVCFVTLGVNAWKGLELLIGFLVEGHVGSQELCHVKIQILVLILDYFCDFIGQGLGRSF